MKPNQKINCLIAIFLLATFSLKAQLSSPDVQVSVDYVLGTLRVTWKDDPGGTSVCRAYATGEKISYRIGAGAINSIFDSSTGISSANNYADFTNLPGTFFSNPVTVIFEGEYGNANTGCGSPLIYTNIQKQIATRIDDPQSPTAGFDVSCDEVPINWLSPTIVAG